MLKRKATCPQPPRFLPGDLPPELGSPAQRPHLSPAPGPGPRATATRSCSRGGQRSQGQQGRATVFPPRRPTQFHVAFNMFLQLVRNILK